MIDVIDSNEPYYYHFDGLGSVMALSDANNLIAERYAYDAFGQPAIVSTDWISQSWGYRKKITIQNDYVDSDLTDFPLYVKISSDPNIGSNAQSDGDDIRFTLGDGITVIPHEKESFSITAGSATGHFWVKVPTVNSSSTTDIYLYYGNSEAEDGQDVDNVWDDNYLGVWHYSEDEWDGTSGEIKDSTSNNCDGRRGGSATTTSDGKIGRAGAFNGSGYAALYNVDNIDNTFTLSAWVLNNNDLDEETGAWFGWPIVAQGFPYYLGWQGWSDGWTLCFYSSSTKYALDTYNKYITADTWYYMSGTYDSSSLYIYRNGASIGSSSKGDHDVDNVSTVISGDGAWDGLIDEVRISSTNRSADWIKFEYRNMAEADNELTWAAEEEAPQVSPLSDLIGNPYMFTGRRFDLETGLYYYRARYYDPDTGRFLQTDPIGYGDGINWYNYCGNNPLNFTDPSGSVRLKVTGEYMITAWDNDPDEGKAALALAEYADLVVNLATLADVRKKLGESIMPDFIEWYFNELERLAREVGSINDNRDSSSIGWRAWIEVVPDVCDVDVNGDGENDKNDEGPFWIEVCGIRIRHGNPWSSNGYYVKYGDAADAAGTAIDWAQKWGNDYIPDSFWPWLWPSIDTDVYGKRSPYVTSPLIPSGNEAYDALKSVNELIEEFNDAKEAIENASESY